MPRHFLRHDHLSLRPVLRNLDRESLELARRKENRRDLKARTSSAQFSMLSQDKSSVIDITLTFIPLAQRLARLLQRKRNPCELTRFLLAFYLVAVFVLQHSGLC